MYASRIIMRILKRGMIVSHQQQPLAPAVVELQPGPFVQQADAALEAASTQPWPSAPPVVTSTLLARPPRRLPYTNRPPVPIPAPDAVVAPVAVDAPPPTGPAPAALAIQTPALRLQQAATTAWEKIERIDRYRLARGLKLRMRLSVTVCDTERHTYANWPNATATVEVGEPGQPGIENGKDLVWAIDEMVEAVGRVGPEKVARMLRELRPPAVDLSVVPVIPAGEQVG